jgi:signal transduction histidine kinase
VVGFIQFTFPTGTFDMERLPPELEFLSRVNRAIVVSALVAMLLALLIGATLASTISRPVRELTAATKALAGGDLGHQVPVRTDDEVGELAQSFNQMSADLARSNQIRKQMTADIAHDLRTPLSVILGYSEALADGKLPGNVETYGAMHLQAQHLSRLIDDLRTLSLADAGQLSLQRREVDPLDLLEHTALANLPQAEARRITLNVQGERGTVILVDPDRLVQVLGNLVGNALRHTPDGGTVTLSTEPSGGQICMQVRDNGSGIAPNDLPHVFDRFYRADQSRTGDGSSGLGLAIARSLIEAHGGQISVTSETGHGSCFTVCLPAVSGSV